MMQDPTPIPWGAQDRFQAHYIVRKDPGNTKDYVARTVLQTAGRFGSKKITGISWQGAGRLATLLNGDSELCEMIAKESLHDAIIFVEPTEGAVRMRGKWDNHLAFGISKEMYAIYDRIAGHIKSL